MELKQSRGKTDYQGNESEGVYKSRTLENFSFIVHDLQLMFCVVDSSKPETSVISYHLVRWGGREGGGRFGWDTWFSGETEGVGGSVFANRVLRGDHRELTVIPMNCQCRGRS